MCQFDEILWWRWAAVTDYKSIAEYEATLPGWPFVKVEAHVGPKRMIGGVRGNEQVERKVNNIRARNGHMVQSNRIPYVVLSTLPKSSVRLVESNAWQNLDFPRKDYSHVFFFLSNFHTCNCSSKIDNLRYSFILKTTCCHVYTSILRQLL